MTWLRTLTLLVVLGATVAAAAPAGAALPKLVGTVGPGFTIHLSRSGKALRTLRVGTYSITVVDRSDIHNFHLRGPGVNREITQIAFVGTKTVVVRLSKGKYTFVCDPHFSTMKGSFIVS